MFAPLALSFLFLPLAVADTVSDDDLIRAYKAAMSKNFLALKDGAIPLYGANYKVGDVWDSKLGRLLESGDRCFTNLSIRSEPYTVPGLTFKQEAALGFMLRLRGVFNSLAKGDDTQTVTVNFVDVIEQTVVEGDLRRAFNSNACPLLKNIIAEGAFDRGAVAPIIIGRLYRGSAALRSRMEIPRLLKLSLMNWPGWLRYRQTRA